MNFRSRRHRHTGFRTRLIASCVVLAAASIGTTAWIAVTSTSSSIRDVYTQNMANVTDVYDRLSGFAATHSSWTGVAPLVNDLARADHTRITLTTLTREPIADSQRGGDGPPGAAARPAAVIHPLEPDVSLGGISLVGGIDARVVGPFALSSAQQAAISAAVRDEQSCYTKQTGQVPPEATTFANGRVYLPLTDFAGLSCAKRPSFLTVIIGTAGEQDAAGSLVRALSTCLSDGTLGNYGALTVHLPATSGNQGTRSLVLDPLSSSFQAELGELIDTITGQQFTCVNNVRRAQLAAYVAPPAQLYLSASTALSAPGLSTDGIHRVAVASIIILLATIAVCLLAATTLRRPLIGLARAVQATAAGARDAAVPLRGTSEMRQLASAVNDLSAQLAEADQRRQDMISDVAHELRTPLANIRGWMEAVHDGVADPGPTLIARLLQEALLLQHLVDELQDLALADAGQLPVHPEQIDVRDCVEQVVAAALATTPSSVPVSADIIGDTVIEADPTRLRQILGNLLSNAIRATEHGTVHITAVGTEQGVVIEVVDTGVGIAAHDLPHLFDRFWRAEKSRSRSRGGSGLGLAITHALIAAHDGSIDIASEPGYGTTVTVRLPRSSPDTAQKS